MSSWDLELAVQHLVANAKPSPIGYCAKYVRQAIEAGGVTLVRHTSAKDYGSSLIKVGFKAITETVPERGHKGDVVVMQAIGSHVHGHMQMYSGTKWISDYVQNGFYPYSVSRPDYQVYRYPAPHQPAPTNPFPGHGDIGGPAPPMWDFLPPMNSPTAPGPGGGGGTGGAPAAPSAPSAPSTSYPGTLLKWGSKGSDVVSVQRRLTQLGWSLSDDGDFGRLTKAAVTSFQQTRGLQDDGIVGSITWKALFG